MTADHQTNNSLNTSSDRVNETDVPFTTIRIRIKVAVWPDGTWTAYGDNTKSAEQTMDEILDAAPGGDSTHWVEATIPLPLTVEGQVS